ncbi:MAG: family 16 glycoside hydrolase [Planctomycetota bacterium]
MLLTIATFCIPLLPQSPAAASRTEVTVAHRDNASARAGLRLDSVPVPARSDAAAKATFTLVDGRLDRGSPGLVALHDGKLPTRADQPDANCFFSRDGGRFVIDLGSAETVASIDTYSWHPGPRGPQVYAVYVADGASNGFVVGPKRDVEPESCGWQLLARVDTRPANGQGSPGGQYAVHIAADGGLGKARYVLFDVVPTSTADRSSNTFFSEIDVRLIGAKSAEVLVGKTDDGRFEVRVDAAAAPALREWCDDELMPVLLQWYPRIVALLAADGDATPTQVDIRFAATGPAVAATENGRVTCNASWLADNLRGQATGALVRELVRVAQHYDGGGDARPAWLMDGIADYVRWFVFEPKAGGGVDDMSDARHDTGGRVTASFLAWALRVHGKDLLAKLDATLRANDYGDATWHQLTGRSLAELDGDWRRSLIAPPGVAELSEAERRAGWQLLFNGVDFRGWHSYHEDVVRSGWQIVDGEIVCADPHDAGDLCTDARYGEFELSIDYKISPGGNSGIMFHVDDSGGATWATGPECQLLDNKAGADPQRAGWLYGLYKTDVDATKPAGEWNTLRILISKQRCEHVMNGVRYFEYVMDSEDFAQRLAKSKFAGMPGFARFDTGYISLQGDHGLVSFRNVKIRPIAPK